MGKSKKLWFKANRKPVGLGRAVEIEEAHRGREVSIVRASARRGSLVGSRKGRFGDTYNVYVRMKGK